MSDQTYVISQQKRNYNDYMASTVWAEKRDRALRFSGGRCQLCSSDHRVTVHHNTYERLGRENPADLVVLCGRCHDAFHMLVDPRTKARYAGSLPDNLKCFSGTMPNPPTVFDFPPPIEKPRKQIPEAYVFCKQCRTNKKRSDFGTVGGLMVYVCMVCAEKNNLMRKKGKRR